MKYSVIIGTYAGQNNLSKMILAILGMTIPPEEIIVWSNYNEQNPFDYSELKNQYKHIQFIECSGNDGCFSRFAMAYLIKSPYVMVFDDDTVPGKRWAENCIESMKKIGDGILGTRGVTLAGAKYQSRNSAGIGAYNEDIKECDLVGHSWFFKRENIKYLFGTLPIHWVTGEDIQLSACAKIAGIRTYAPPHPKENKEFWGSTERGLGNNRSRLCYIDSNQTHKRTETVQFWIKNGWKPLFMEK